MIGPKSVYDVFRHFSVGHFSLSCVLR